MKNILIYFIHFSKTSRKRKKNLPDASLKFIAYMKRDFISFKINIIPVRKHMVGMVVVSDVTYMRQNVTTHVVI